MAAKTVAAKMVAAKMVAAKLVAAKMVAFLVMKGGRRSFQWKKLNYEILVKMPKLFLLLKFVLFTFSDLPSIGLSL